MNEDSDTAANAWVRVALILAAAGSMVILWLAFCSAPGIYWNPPRLAPAFALAEGLPIYATRFSGAHLGWHYGPVFPIFSLPATLAGNIVTAFWIWYGLNLLAICGPAWVVMREALGQGRLVWSALTFHMLLLLSNPVTQVMVYSIHVDALCVGWGLLACWCVHRATREREQFLHGAALNVALAVFTKQVAVCLVPALLLWLWWHDRRALACRLLLWLTMYGGGLAVIFSLWFGGEELMFNLWLIHARTPRWGGLAMVADETIRMLAMARVWFSALALVLVVRWPMRAKGGNSPSLENLLLWVAAFHLPVGLWAVTKVGGGLNSVHSLDYFLPVAVIWLMRIIPIGQTSGGWLRLMFGPTVLLMVLLALASAFDRAIGIQLQWQPDHGQEKILEIARKNPAQAYFPWNPLVTIISDKKIYPFDNALFCLSIAGLSPSVEAVRAAAPPHPMIIYYGPVQSKFMLNYFPHLHPVTEEGVKTRIP